MYCRCKIIKISRKDEWMNKEEERDFTQINTVEISTKDKQTNKTLKLYYLGWDLFFKIQFFKIQNSKIFQRLPKNFINPKQVIFSYFGSFTNFFEDSTKNKIPSRFSKNIPSICTYLEKKLVGFVDFFLFILSVLTRTRVKCEHGQA